MQKYQFWNLRRKHTLSLPKVKDGAPDNMEDEDEEDVVEQSDEDSEDGDSEADLPDALRSIFSRLSTL